MAKTDPYLSFTRGTDYFFVISSVAILLLFIFFFDVWYKLCFNILFIGYFIFGEIRLASVFYAVLIRIILYPSALINKHFAKDSEETGEKYQEIQSIDNVLERAFQKKTLLRTKKILLAYSWFHLCLLTVNAITIGAIFFQDFTKEKLSQMLYSEFYVPKNFPVNTFAQLPIIGQVDLAIPNMTLNFYSAVGAGLVGLAEVLLNKKIKRRDLLKYLLLFPLGAYYLTFWVPSGFELTLLIFELLTFGIIVVENIAKSKFFKFVAGKEEKIDQKEKLSEEELKKEEVKQLIKDIVIESNAKPNKDAKKPP